MTESKNFIHVTIKTGISQESYKFDVPQGTTVEQVVSRYSEELREYLVVYSDGLQVKENFNSIVPKETLEIDIVPGTLGPEFWILLAIYIVGTLILYTLFDSKQQGEDSDLYAVRGQKNSDALYEPVPIILGKRRVIPNLAAAPWTEIEGNESYIRLLLSVGHKPLKIEDVRIGDTPIDQFGDDIQVQINDGFFNDDTITLFPYDIVEEPVQKEFDVRDQPEIRTTVNDTDRVGIDLFFPQGLHTARSNGNIDPATVFVLIEYSLINQNNWQTSNVKITSESFVTSAKAEQEVTTGITGGIEVLGWTARITDKSLLPIDSEEPVKVTVAGQTIDPSKYEFGFTTGIVVFDRNDTNLQNLVRNNRNNVEISGKSLRGASIENGVYSVTQRFTKPFYRNVSFDLPSRGQYDVRLTRLNNSYNPDRPRTRNQFTWSTMRSFRNQPPVITDAAALIAIRIRATERASGTLDRVNCIATSVVPNNWNIDWSQWNTSVPVPLLPNLLGKYQKDIFSRISGLFSIEGGFKVSQNPGELFRWLIQGPYLKTRVPNSKLDLPSILSFINYCDTKSLTCNAIVTKQKTLARALNLILRTSFAELIVRDSKYGISIDAPKSIYTAAFSFKNANNFAMERTYLAPVDGYRVQFDNEANEFEEFEINVYYDDLEETTGNFETMKLWGITNSDQATRYARRFLAARRFQKETYSLRADIAAIDVTRGDLVLVQYPTIASGRASGYVTAVSPSTITVDEFIETESGSFGVQIVQVNNVTGKLQILYKTVTNINGKVLTLENTTNINVGDRYLFGLANNESIEALVREVRPNADMTFEIKMIKYTPEIYSVDDDEIPSYPGDGEGPPSGGDGLPKPFFTNIVAYRTGEFTQTGKSLSQAYVFYGLPALPGFLSDTSIELQYKKDIEPFYETTLTQPLSGPPFFVVDRLEDFESYNFRIRLLRSGQSSDWTYRSEFISPDTSGDPELPPVSGLELFEGGNEFTGRNVKIKWRGTSTTNSYELGEEPSGGDSGGLDSFFKDFFIEVRDANTDQLYREATTTSEFFEYSYENNVSDGGPRRRLKFVVYQRGNANQLSIPASIIVNNPPPQIASSVYTEPNFGSFTIGFDVPTDLDYEGVDLYVSTSSGPIVEDNLRYSGPDNRITIQGLESGVEYYAILRPYDAFGKEDTFSQEFLIRTIRVTDKDTDDTIPCTPNNLQVEEITPAVQFVPNIIVRLTWDKSEGIIENNNCVPINFFKIITGYFVRYWTTNPDSFTEVFTSATSENIQGLDGNTEYFFSVAATDWAGNVSPFSSPVSITVSGDNVPPGNVQDVTVVGGLDKVVVDWINPPDLDFLQTYVYAGTSSTFTANDSSLVYTGRGTELVYSRVVANQDYYFKFVTEDTSRNKSDVSVAYGPGTPFKIDTINIDDYFDDFTIGGEKIVPGSITGVSIGDLTIGGDKIIAGSITGVNIAQDGITAEKIAANAILADKIAANAITADKIEANAVIADKIAANAIISDKIAANAITADKINANAVTADKIAANSIDADKIVANSITGDKIQAKSIEAGKLSVTQLSAIAADLGTVNAGTLTGATVQTSATGGRVQLTSAGGIEIYNSGNTRTMHFRTDGGATIGIAPNNISIAENGVVSIPSTIIAGEIITNSLKTAQTGWRVEIGPLPGATDLMRIWNGTTTTSFSVNSTGTVSLSSGPDNNVLLGLLPIAGGNSLHGISLSKDNFNNFFAREDDRIIFRVNDVADPNAYKFVFESDPGRFEINSPSFKVNNNISQFSGVVINPNFTTNPTSVVVIGGELNSAALTKRNGLGYNDVNTTSNIRQSVYEWKSTAWELDYSLSGDGIITLDKIFIGRGVGRSDTNLVVGLDAYKDSLPTATNNIAIGNLALRKSSSTVGLNTAVGSFCMAGFGQETRLYDVTSNLNSCFGALSGFNIASGGSNSAFGAYSLTGTTHINEIPSSFSNNNAFGRESLLNLYSGTNNTAIGVNTGRTLVTASNNTLVGNSIASVASGAQSPQDNCIFGFQAGFNLRNSNNNCAFGLNSMVGTTSSNYAQNCAFGNYSLQNLTTGFGNCAFGHASGGLSAGTTFSGSNNALYGYFSGPNITSGSNNVFIGRDSGTNVTTGNNNIGIGFNVGATGQAWSFAASTSNRVVIGNSTNNVYGVYSQWDTPSDERDKTDFEPMEHGLDVIKNIETYTFRFDRREWYLEEDEETGEIIEHEKDGSKKSDKLYVGYSAQQFLSVLDDVGFPKNIIVDEEDSDNLKMKETAIIPLLINAIKEQQKQIEDLQQLVNSLISE